MPRPVWSGAISFGLVTIPVKVLPATENRSISFHQYHLEDEGRIRTRKVCEIDGKQLRSDEIGKGYEVSKDTIVQVTDEDLDSIPLPTAKAIEIVAFVPADSIDPVRIGDSYYLAADGAVAAKPYVLLRKALERSAKVAVAKFAWHNRERLGLLRIKENAIVLHSMRWPDEIRDPAELTPKPVELDDSEIDAAIQLMETMAADDISGYTDHYREALEEVIVAKAAGRTPPQAESGQEPAGQVVDLMSALNASVAAAKESRGESGGHATVHDMPKKGAAKKTAAKKSTAAAKKTASKKAPAKKATGRKPKSA
ncbi:MULTISPECIES: Ku protein [unclassified Streptomyces]|uniref:non-homologous end joining protein Ku n=1 Tax=unclassified Streptomyces TaxID=2593676 RepID=UPI002DD85AC6|nr:Ku protein [Streptomyces sp. NBC_01750]WSB01468.1 Ku protein [Streptomyces sp. NBC_01794]WSD34203.1 Ku protein [Streptomyces sp. NBC_01750]